MRICLFLFRSCVPVSRDNIASSILKLIKVTCWFSIGSRAHVWLTCCKQGRVVRKRVDPIPRLKFNRIINFSCIQMFFTGFVLCILSLFNQNRRPEENWNLHCKVTKRQPRYLGLFPSPSENELDKTEIQICFYPGLA